MKKLFLLLLAAVLLAAAVSSCYDDTKIQKDLQDLEARVSALEELMKTANSNIVALQTAVGALEGKVYVSNVATNGDSYTIAFSDGKTINIKNGSAPAIGLKQEGGVYYWTLNGTWLLDSNGKKVSATGTTPQFKIEDGYWYISTDGSTWTQLGKATGDPGHIGEAGPQGEPGPMGESLIKDIYWDDDFVYIVLQDNSQLTLPLHGTGNGAGSAVKLILIPDLSDGSVLTEEGSFEIKFAVLPYGMADRLASLDLSCFNLSLSYVQNDPATKVAPGDVSFLNVTAASASEDVLTLVVDSQNLDASFFFGKLGVSAALSINNDGNVVGTDYFPLYCGPRPVDLGVSVKWATCNVGAWHPTQPGWYFAWAETHYKSYYAWTSYKWCDYDPQNEWYQFYRYNGDYMYGPTDNYYEFFAFGLEDDAAYVNWGGRWRTPTKAEMKELLDDCSWEWVTNYKGSGVNGAVVSGNGNSIFLPAVGFTDRSSVSGNNEDLKYWTATRYNTFNAHVLYSYDKHFYFNYDYRCYGIPVRPVTEGWDYEPIYY